MFDEREKSELKLSNVKEQHDLLNEILTLDEEKIVEERDEEKDEDFRELMMLQKETTSIKGWTGANDGFYTEYMN